MTDKQTPAGTAPLPDRMQAAIDRACGFLGSWEAGDVDTMLSYVEPQWITFAPTPKSDLMEIAGGRVDIKQPVNITSYGSHVAVVDFSVSLTVARGVKRSYRMSFNMMCLGQGNLPDPNGVWYVCANTLRRDDA